MTWLKTNLDLNETRGHGFGMQWRQLDHTQTICTSVQTDNHTNTSSLNFYRPDALPDVQPTVSSTEGKVAAVLVVNDHIAVASYGTALTRAGYFSTSQLAVTCPAKIAMGGLSQHLIAGCSGTPKFSPQTAYRSVQLFLWGSWLCAQTHRLWNISNNGTHLCFPFTCNVA